MSGELGRATLDLEANLRAFEKNMAAGKHSAEGLERTLDAVAAIANVAEKALNDVGMSPRKAAESRISAEGILAGVRGIGDESRMAALELDRVKLTETQAAETEVSAGVISRALDRIHDQAAQAKRELLEVKLAGGRTGVGVGPFGSGFGRVGVLGAGVGVAALTAPAAAPAALGVLAGIPTLVAGGVGALGTLALAFDGVTKAIGGDKKAFDDLGPSAKQFVLTVRSLDGWFDKLRQTAGAALFPGLTAGLKAALSVGTVGAISKAVTELGRALGAAGAAWGRYFGSKEFQSILGPLMASAARNIGVLSDAFLHLFDALGVIGRAAIPFTNWLNTAIDKGAKLADSWTHAEAASGGLAHAMDAARTSLTLVAHAFGAVFNVIEQLGKALYPVSNVALRDLTGGLNALAGVISRNQGLIRDLVGGALTVLVGAVKAAAAGIGVVVHGLQHLIGEKATVIAALTAIGAVIASTLGPYSLAIGGAILAIGLIKNHWRTVEHFFVNLGHEIIGALEYAWYAIEKGALIAALKVVEPFSHLPSFLGGWARKAKNAMQAQLDRLQPPNMAWGGYAEKAGAYTGGHWRQGFMGAVAGVIGDALNAVTGALRHAGHKHRKPSSSSPPPVPSSTAALPADVFGTPPPFTSTGSGSGSHRRHRMTVAQRAQLRLQYALDTALAAVQAATQGTKAWDRAINAEKVALNAEIRYWTARAHNDDLSMKLRDVALRKEIAYEKELKGLTTQLTKATAQAAAANEAQFIQSFVEIQNTFAPNAIPYQAPSESGKTNTHLHDVKQELREQTRHLKKLTSGARFPGSLASAAAATAVNG